MDTQLTLPGMPPVIESPAPAPRPDLDAIEAEVTGWGETTTNLDLDVQALLRYTRWLEAALQQIADDDWSLIDVQQVAKTALNKE